MLQLLAGLGVLGSDKRPFPVSDPVPVRDADADRADAEECPLWQRCRVADLRDPPLRDPQCLGDLLLMPSGCGTGR